MMNFFGEISVNYILFCTKGHLSINSKLLSYVLDGNPVQSNTFPWSLGVSDETGSTSSYL
jgi:hypothetical protein